MSSHVWGAGVEVGSATCKGAKEPFGKVSHPQGETAQEAHASLGSGFWKLWDSYHLGDCPKGEGAKENLGGISYLSVRYESRSEGLCGCETQRTAMEDEITARQKQNTTASARPHAVTEKKQKTFTEKKADHPGWTPKAETTGVVFIDLAT